ncbi:MAG: DUF3450 domain-containing protein [Desulfovibrionaceae bacterium]
MSTIFPALPSLAVILSALASVGSAFSRLFRISTLLFLLALTAPSQGSAYQADNPADTVEDMADALQTASEAQRAAQHWAAEREALLEELREKQRYSLWLDHQLAKHETYIREQEQAVRLLQERRTEAGRIRLLLEPYLDDMAARLDQAVRNDLPFLAEERSDRMAALRAMLDDPDASLGEKLRRTLEALQIEAQFGSETTVEEGVIQTDGGAMQGWTLRCGRLAALFLSRDKQRAWSLAHDGSGWSSLPQEDAARLAEALRMAQRTAPAGLALLPVGGMR